MPTDHSDRVPVEQSGVKHARANMAFKLINFINWMEHSVARNYSHHDQASIVSYCIKYLDMCILANQKSYLDFHHALLEKCSNV